MKPPDICIIIWVDELDHKNQYHHQRYYPVVRFHRAKQI